VVYDDGVHSGTGASHAFLTYIRHPAVGFRLQPYHLGSSDEEALHCLVFDLEAGSAFIAARVQAGAMLREQHPEEEMAHFAVADLDDLTEALAGFEEFRIASEELACAMQEQHDAITTMVAKLDRWQAEQAAT
jgi:hypothetical protein